ncbi:MAG: DUF4922 domain-containing protein [Melioribacteraceae bacterium]
MNNKIFISDKELKTYGSTDTLSDEAISLLLHQKNNWELVRSNFQNLEQIKTKDFNFDDYKIKVQFNPSRIVSSSAKVDKKTIKDRACFLCEENLPDVQKGIKYKDDYVILINPFPIFKQHLTIPHLKHTPQNIENSIEDLLDIAYDLRDNFFVFYNGPKCGASAPDHLHFQAGLKNSTPIEINYKYFAEYFGRELFSQNNSKVVAVNHQLNRFFFFEAKEKSELVKLFIDVVNQLKKLSTSKEEPLMNIISTYTENSWKVFLFPRKLHRPKQFFAEDDSKILFSPAAVDMAGLCITPQEKDFNKITNEDLVDMFEQVMCDSFTIENLQIL